MDFVKDQEELFSKTNEHFKGKARKKCLWERYANNCKLSVKVCNTWLSLKGHVTATTVTDTFTKLKCNFNICVIDSDASKTGHPSHSAEPSGKQRTAVANHRAADFFPSS